MALRRRAALVSVQLISAVQRSSPSSCVALQACGADQAPTPSLQVRPSHAISSARAHILNGWPLHWSRRMSCCAGLGSPPPREIIVEYSEDDNYTDEFIKLANAIEEAYPEFVVSGNPDAVQPRKGAFEITLEDAILFSKLKMNRLPELTEILTAISAVPPPACAL